MSLQESGPRQQRLHAPLGNFCSRVGHVCLHGWRNEDTQSNNITSLSTPWIASWHSQTGKGARFLHRKHQYWPGQVVYRLACRWLGRKYTFMQAKVFLQSPGLPKELLGVLHRSPHAFHTRAKFRQALSGTWHSPCSIRGDDRVHKVGMFSHRDLSIALLSRFSQCHVPGYPKE